MSAKQIGSELIISFSPRDSLLLEEAIVRILERHGYSSLEAAEQAEDKCRQVLAYLRGQTPETLPFEIHEGKFPRLVGKSRPRSADSAEVAALRRRVDLVPAIQEAICQIDGTAFERLCTKIMVTEGAEAHHNGGPGDGGIDLYGRIPMGRPVKAIPQGLIRTRILRDDLLFLGQCKRIDPSHSVEPSEIQEFDANCRACLDHYSGNPSPPPRRVPPDFYWRNETALKLFFTTGSFGRNARGAAQSSDIRLVDGRHIAEYLAATLDAVSDAASQEGNLVQAIHDWAMKSDPRAGRL